MAVVHSMALHDFIKKSQKTPKLDLDLGARRKTELDTDD
jgi:phage-related protein